MFSRTSQKSPTSRCGKPCAAKRAITILGIAATAVVGLSLPTALAQGNNTQVQSKPAPQGLTMSVEHVTHIPVRRSNHTAGHPTE